MIQMLYNDLYSYDDFGLIVKTVNRPLLPSKRRSDVVIPGRDGTYDFGDDSYENIVIPVVIQCISDTFPEARSRARSISAWLGQASYNPLIFTDEPDKYYLAKIYDGTALEKIVNLNPGESATVNFECQPLACSIDNGSWIGQSGLSGLIENDGTYKTFPIIFITPDPLSGNLKLFNPYVTIGPNTLIYTGTLAAGEELVINCETYQATKNSTNILSAISGEWPVLEIGNNTVLLNDTIKECMATVRISYKKRWL